MFVYRTKALHKQFSENAHFGKFSITQYEIFSYAQLSIFYPGSLLGYKSRKKAWGSKDILNGFTMYNQNNMRTLEGFCNYCCYFSGKLINVKKFHSLKIIPVEHTKVRSITVKQHILLNYFAITFYSISWGSRLLLQQPLKAIQLYIYNSIYPQNLCCSTVFCLEAQLLPFRKVCNLIAACSLLYRRQRCWNWVVRVAELTKALYSRVIHIFLF